MDGIGDVAEGEPAGLLGDRRVEHDLVEQVAQLGAELIRAVTGVGVVRVDGLEDLVGLLEQVLLQRVVGLLGLPRVVGPQPVHDVVEAGDPCSTRRWHLRDPQRREVVRFDRPIHLGPRHLEDHLVVQTEALQQRDRRVAGVVDAQLDVGQHEPVVALRDQQRAALPRALGRVPVPVDDPDPELGGVDAEPHPGEVQERQRRVHPDVDPPVGEQQLDGVLRDDRRTRHGVEDRTVAGFGTGRGDQLLDDLAVHVVERPGGLVEVVEGDRVGHDDRRGVPVGAQEAARDRPDQLEGAGGDQVRATGTEPDDVDHRGGQLSRRRWRPGRPRRRRATRAGRSNAAGARVAAPPRDRRRAARNGRPLPSRSGG